MIFPTEGSDSTEFQLKTYLAPQISERYPSRIVYNAMFLYVYVRSILRLFGWLLGSRFVFLGIALLAWALPLFVLKDSHTLLAPLMFIVSLEHLYYDFDH